MSAVFPYVVLALLNGVLIGTSRAVNGQLAARIGAFRASVWNHVVGFAFLTLFLLGAMVLFGSWPGPGDAPPAAYLGGVFGALFVAVNSHVFPRLGAMNASLLVIGGQVLSAVLLDCVAQRAWPTALRMGGMALVLAGLILPRVVQRGRPR
ncbi:DMT family transporter [Streptomyces sp. NPDC050264]|uniref:DMT family transporter n=1 Tax=Streptomyces sp. NPDC050264 TaxID=3155038 RepID=UPI00343B6D19